MEIISGRGSSIVSVEIISGRGSCIESVCGDYKWAWFFYRECLWRL